jgi:hypothetical protein
VTDGPWHVISSEDLRHMLARVAEGEDPEAVHLELYANADHEYPQEPQ